jgi:hypothetical protein
LDSQDSSNLSFNMYMVIGGIITLIIGYISFRFFVRKSNLK